MTRTDDERGLRAAGYRCGWGNAGRVWCATGVVGVCVCNGCNGGGLCESRADGLCIVDWEGGRIRRECASLEGRAGSCDMHLQRADTCCCSPARTLVSSRMRAHGVWMWGDGEAGITCVARCFCAVPVTSPASERASRVLAGHATISPAAVISRRRHRSLDRTAGPACVIAPTQHPARVSGLGRRRRRGRGAARSVARPVTVWCERPWTSLWRRG